MFIRRIIFQLMIYEKNFSIQMDSNHFYLNLTQNKCLSFVKLTGFEKKDKL